MCGFIGFTEKVDLQSYRDTLGHRGPDYVGFYQDERVSLLHNRLSIIDLNPEANQPMEDGCGNIIVFNGEIYNYAQLRSAYALECKTRSDTEVILRLYEKLGKDFVNELNGIFAFVIYDTKRKKLMLYRDRFGVKPLYYVQNKDNFAFASEIKPLLKYGNGFNMQMIFEYLEYGLLNHQNETLYENIVSLPQAHYAEFDLDTQRFEVARYWDIGTEKLDISEKEALEQTYALLNDCMRLNMVSDVEVAVSLSSGADSTLLTHLVQQNGQRLKAFTFGFDDKDYDEVLRIKQNPVFEAFEHFPVYLKKADMLETLKEAIHFFETPLGGLGTLSAYHMTKEVKRQGIRVLLTGEGSDETFGGYQYYYGSLFRDLTGTPLLAQELEAYNRKHGKTLAIGTKEYDEFVGLSEKIRVMAPDGTSALASHVGEALKTYRLEGRQGSTKFSDYLSNVMYVDMFQKKLPKLLHFQDRASMGNSVEARVPFLDHRLIQFVYSLPSQYKIHRGETKFLLKQILRQKTGYQEIGGVKHYVATPQREWIKDRDMQNQILETVRQGVLVRDKIIDFDAFKKDYDIYAGSSELGNSFFVWKVINLAFMFDIFGQGVK